jgi:hypothetical protein
MIPDPALAWIRPTLGVAGVTLLVGVFVGRYWIPRLFILVVSFLVGLWEIILSLLSAAKGLIDLATFVVMLISGVALFSKPTRNIRWAALLGLAAGIAATYCFNMIIGFAVPSALILVFLASSLIVYLLLKFAEDLLDVSRAILEIPPVSIAIGVICIIWTLR